ncbi:MAG: nucleotide exchange factor GrpE, partial [Candidatus Doudnabacteria bacterium]|nr:nucleotide exchange factor GrpE [Candidatus Doudnabacteria bacterium]
WKRAAADFENYKKRRSREDQELLGFAKQMVIFRLLPTFESLEQALTLSPAQDNFEEWKRGIEKVRAGLADALAGLGVERIKTVGEKFNHEFHDAVEMVEEKGKSGEVVAEVSAGYRIDGHVARPAKVKVAR